MASINVRPELFSPVESSNKECLNSIIKQVRPQTSNLSGTTLSGDMIYDFTTGANEWFDLYKAHIVCRYTPTFAAAVNIEMLATCLFDRAQLYLNGTKVANSNNYTQDSILSKRLNFGSDYNSKVNGVRYDFTTPPTDAFPAASTFLYTSIEHLDGLFMRTPDMFIPPNTNVRLVLSVSPNYLAKSIRQTTVVTSLAINDVFLNSYTITSSEGVTGDHVVKFITPESYLGTATANYHAQYQLKSNTVRLCATMQSNLATAFTSGSAKVYSSTLFRYPTDIRVAGVDSATKVNTLYFKYGSQQIPQSGFNETLYGHDESHAHFINNSEMCLDASGGEGILDWTTQGKIYTVPVVKSSTDSSMNAEVNITFEAAPATTNVFFTAWYENIVKMVYANGVPIETSSSV